MNPTLARQLPLLRGNVHAVRAQTRVAVRPNFASVRRSFSVDNDDSHDDFKTIRKKYEAKDKGSGNVKDLIAETIASKPVVVFMKGTPSAPQCGFSATVVRILQMQGLKDFKGVNVLEDDTIRNGIKEYTNWPTIPQVFVNKEFIGGCDIMRSMHESGELKTLLQESGVISATAEAK
ncbi:monothiol glutaredoxin-5, mitochondrial precursor [Planoprotostelium fungivorum]|uniref:Monothiol glutaredoxin-5, mitochondrial n=1 Tax=Planoprotostelium fungivorum TaxID=1890364 RepID=A0A2P6NVX6_9EUKA|nr:monothiol glutaredoxin-5, mitochondrial precursor [Planoprotostelium fungivorum]